MWAIVNRRSAMRPMRCARWRARLPRYSIRWRYDVICSALFWFDDASRLELLFDLETEFLVDVLRRAIADGDEKRKLALAPRQQRIDARAQQESSQPLPAGVGMCHQEG